MQKHIKATIIVILIFFTFLRSDISSKPGKFKLIDWKNISRYSEDRIAFQRIEKITEPDLDSSVEILLVIKKRKIYLMQDGYDFIGDVKYERFKSTVGKQFAENDSYWKNLINGKPDFIKISNRRIEKLTNTNEEFVAKNFGNFYMSVRDKFLKRHVKIFKQLMKNRGESYFKTYKKRILNFPDREGKNDKPKYAQAATAKALDNSIYYCEDADGDGITETFIVSRKDDFNWGVESGPNIIHILNNKGKDIESIIGKLTDDALYGSVEEEKEIIQTFPDKEDIHNMIDSIIPDQRFYTE